MGYYYPLNNQVLVTMTEDPPKPDFDELTSLYDTLVEQFNKELVDAYYGMFDTTHVGIKGHEYRLAVAREFIRLSGGPPKKKGGDRYRNADESALDRSFTQVADSYDVCEPTIRERCTVEYEGSHKTEQFRNELCEMRNKLNKY